MKENLLSLLLKTNIPRFLLLVIVIVNPSKLRI